MMKKIVMACAVLLCIGTVNLFAWAIGVQGGTDIGPSVGGNASITFKLDNIPWVFAANVGIGGGTFTVGATADNWLFNKDINSFLKWYVGWGLFGSVTIGDYFGGSFGARVPVGLNAFFADNFVEPYLQVAPSLGLSIYNGLGFYWSIPINLGVRFWIK